VLPRLDATEGDFPMLRKNNKALLDAEEQLVFGRSLPEVRVARDNLRQALPGCLLLELLEAKITRMKNAPPRGISPWGA
jgi:hypothetical protein